jgi:hypothetical protein
MLGQRPTRLQGHSFLSVVNAFFQGCFRGGALTELQQQLTELEIRRGKPGDGAFSVLLVGRLRKDLLP